MSKKILFILEFGESVPSGILRGKIYKPEFDRLGIKVKFINRNNVFLINKLAKGTRLIFLYKSLNFIYKVIISLWIFFYSKFYKSIWLSKVLSPRFIFILRKFNPRKQINLDVVDNPYENNQNWVNTLNCVSSITTDNIYNREILSNFNTKVNVIPDYPLLDKFINFSKNKAYDDFTFGWIGSHSSFYLLDSIKHDIIKFLLLYPNSTFYLLGCPIKNDFESISNVKIINFYDEKKMIEVLSKIKVGLFPLDDSVASKVRGVLKATLYMASYSIVITNPIGETLDLIENNIDGLFVHNSKGWFESLELLRNNPSLCDKIAQNARNKVYSKYSLNSNITKILEYV